MKLELNTKPQDVTHRHGNNAIMIVYEVVDNENTESTLKDFCANFTAYIRSMQHRYPDQDFSCIVGFGSDLWDRMFAELGKPKELEVFKEIRGDRFVAVSTPGDLFFHIRARSMGVCHEFAEIIDNKLGSIVKPIDEVHGFRYKDGRAIIGFVDGTENPAVDDDPLEFGVIMADDDSRFEGGSYVFVQKYIHNMKAWNMLAIQEQEKVIGRRKYDDLELSDEDKPLTAHNKVTNVVDEQGNELKIVRANMPFANTSRGEYGTYFIGYAGKFSTTQIMLERMFIGEPRGVTDKLLEFSDAVTGTMFFVPSYDILDEMGS